MDDDEASALLRQAINRDAQRYQVNADNIVRQRLTANRDFPAFAKDCCNVVVIQLCQAGGAGAASIAFEMQSAAARRVISRVGVPA